MFNFVYRNYHATYMFYGANMYIEVLDAKYMTR